MGLDSFFALREARDCLGARGCLGAAVEHFLSAAEPWAFVATRCTAAAALLGHDGCCCKCGTKAASYRHGMCVPGYEWYGIQFAPNEYSLRDRACFKEVGA